jgi:cysteine synthase B
MAQMTTISDETRAATVSDLLAKVAVVRAIGNTPLLRLSRLAERWGISPSVEIWLKAEWVNPGGSVKDRPALWIIRAALESGQLGDGKALLDSTSGNTGIAYAMLGAAIGIPIELVVPGSASVERKQILAAYGAKIVESDPYDGSDGAIRLVREMVAADSDRYFFADQYSNPANPAAHVATTGPEIWSQTNNRVTHFVAGLGTTGTLMGTGRYLKQQNPSIELIGVQPADSFHGLEGLKHLPTAIVPAIYDASLPDRLVEVETGEAYSAARELARLEGLFVGASTGGALVAALRMGAEATAAGEPAVIVAIAPDNGSKYLSTGLWGNA